MQQAHWLRVFDADYRKLTNQYRFISEIIDGKLVVSKKKKSVLVQELRQRKYEPFPKGETGKKAQDEEEEFEDEEEDEVAEGTAGDYDYLLSVSSKSTFIRQAGRDKRLTSSRWRSGHLHMSALSA